MAMKFKIAAFLEQETIDHIDRIAVSLAKKHDIESTRSAAIHYLVMQHWKKTKIKDYEVFQKRKQERKLLLAS
tara:strand:+ start:419 stop:637 length:219 start_codon:yes stop_codon:yes gene_type:complete